MAQWVQRPRSDGGMSGQIKWRQDGRYHCETFTNIKLAVEFRSAVEAAGNRWPAGWINGQGWVPVTPPTVVITFTDVATGENGFFAQQERRVKRGKLTPYTAHRDRRTYALHFEETFGHLDFTASDENDVAGWIDDKIDAGAAPKTIRNRHGLLSSIMKHGRLRMKLRPDNPCELSELPDVDTARPEARQIRFFHKHEWALLRSCLATDIRLALDVDLAQAIHDRWSVVTP